MQDEAEWELFFIIILFYSILFEKELNALEVVLVINVTVIIR